MLHKKNTFTDFIAVAEHLIAQKYGAAGPPGDRRRQRRRPADGRGRPTCGPDLFKAVVAQVPFVDVINTMSDATLPLTVGEFEEWGNPAGSRAEYDYIKSYDPYTQPHGAGLSGDAGEDVAQRQPGDVLGAGQVRGAAARAARPTRTRCCFKINMAAGHGGSSGRYDRLKEIAFDYSFVLWQLGLDCGC